MANGRVDPYPAFAFKVELDGIFVAAFTDVGGMDTTVEVTEFAEGGDRTAKKLPGKVKYSNITLKYGLTDDRSLYDWLLAAAKGDVQRKSGSIVILDLQGNEKVRWNFRDAWPTSWKGAALAAKGNEYAIEEMDLAHEGIERVS
ncbi:MAG TPA: phage tail protein [Mycobacterium sp.]|jgi:phage tail-like protein